MFVCKICDYERDSEPKESWDTCPNCDNFDWMVKGERNDKKWTTEPPTQEGWYWVKCKGDLVINAYRPSGVECLYFVHGSDGLYAPTAGYEYCYGLEYFTHWFGPLLEQVPPKDN